MNIIEDEIVMREDEEEKGDVITNTNRLSRSIYLSYSSY